MNDYIATFHTHFAALSTCRKLQNEELPAEMGPVPRALSADCGTCVVFTASTPCRELMHADFERVVIALDDGTYQTVEENNAS